MKEIIKQLIMEAPLPDDWDHQVYTPKATFASKIKYATERATKIGSGSSRVAFIIDYQGRKTVLKVAKNPKGIAQNLEGIGVLNDYYLKNLQLFIPMIDYDEKNEDHPQWIHAEFAEKCKAADFKKACGGSPSDLVAYATKYMGKKVGSIGNAQFINPDAEFVEAFVDYAGNYDANLSDYTRLANWGLYQGRPVILDAGFSDEVYTTYYS